VKTRTMTGEDVVLRERWLAAAKTDAEYFGRYGNREGAPSDRMIQAVIAAYLAAAHREPDAPEFEPKPEVRAEPTRPPQPQIVYVDRPVVDMTAGIAAAAVFIAMGAL